MKMLIPILLSSWFLSAEVFAADKLVILSPHRKTTQKEFIPVFEEYYKKKYGTEIHVEWLDQGGTSNAVKYLQGKAASNPNNVGVDVFWGGPSANFIDMANQGLFAPYALSKEARAYLPKECAGVPLSDPKDRWHAANISSFGIMFNRPVLKLEKLPEPATWADLGRRDYYDGVILADPRNSGTNNTMMFIVLQSMGWEKGWELLTSIFGNARRVTHSSSDPIQAVITGDAATALMVDFYGLAQVWELGADKIGFILPAGQTVLDPDAVAVVKGAKNVVQAQRFVDFLMTDDAQKLWILPKGHKGGPKFENLARLAISPKVYEATKDQRLEIINPFEAKKMMDFDADKASKLRKVLNDYIGTLMIDTHKELKTAVKYIKDKNLPPAATAWLGQPMLSEKEMLELAEKWDNDVFRNETINKWTAAAKAKYSTITSGKTPWAG